MGIITSSLCLVRGFSIARAGVRETVEQFGDPVLQASWTVDAIWDKCHLCNPFQAADNCHTLLFTVKHQNYD